MLEGFFASLCYFFPFICGNYVGLNEGAMRLGVKEREAVVLVWWTNELTTLIILICNLLCHGIHFSSFRWYEIAWGVMGNDLHSTKLHEDWVYRWWFWDVSYMILSPSLSWVSRASFHGAYQYSKAEAKTIFFIVFQMFSRRSEAENVWNIEFRSFIIIEHNISRGLQISPNPTGMALRTTWKRVWMKFHHHFMSTSDLPYKCCEKVHTKCLDQERSNEACRRERHI